MKSKIDSDELNKAVSNVETMSDEAITSTEKND